MPKDKLDKMFEAHKQFMDLLGSGEIREMNTMEAHNKVRECLFYMIQELMEVAEHLWKPWKKNKKRIDVHKFFTEIADVYFFYIELCILVGMKPDVLYKKFMMKMVINIERQRRGY